MITVAYHTLGCKVNQYETERIREALETAGFTTVPFGSPADAYIVNTCSVTDVADSKSRSVIRRALRLNPQAYVVVAGCYAELEPGRIAAIEGVDLVVPNAEKDTIPGRLLSHFSAAREQAIPQSEIRNPKSPRPRLRTRAVVKVQDGCDQFCSYCVVPFARRGMTSRPIKEVLAELRSLAEFGYREVVLTGIRLGSYEHGQARLPELIRAAAETEGIERIRLSSIEVWEVNNALLDALTLPKVCRHLHIPLQSGDDDVLRRMNRPYDTARYRDTISRVRARIPGIGITTDVIVGFPGETDEEFAATCAFIEEIGFSRLHVFRYSPRRRTRAASFADQVEPAVKKLRAEKLAEMGRMALLRAASSLVGESVEVLAECEAKAAKHLTGFTDNYVEVRFVGEPALRGEIVRVRITGADGDGSAKGEIDRTFPGQGG